MWNKMGTGPYLEMGLIYYVAWEDYVNSLDSLDKEMQETEFPMHIG